MVTEPRMVHSEELGTDVLEVDGIRVVHTGPTDQESLNEHAKGIRQSQWADSLAHEVVDRVFGEYEKADQNAMESFFWDLVDSVEPFSLSFEGLEGVAKFIAGNRPLMDFLQAQTVEKQIRQDAYKSGEPIIGGPTHAAVTAVLATLRSLDGQGQE